MHPHVDYGLRTTVYRGEMNNPCKDNSKQGKTSLKTTLILASVLLAGCATPRPPDTDKVQVIQANSPLASKCKMLGPVYDRVGGGWTHGSLQAIRTELVWNMRAKAYQTYEADALAIQAIERTGFAELSGSGVALKCYQQQ